MFKFLKDKLKKAVGSFAEKVDEETEELPEDSPDAEERSDIKDEKDVSESDDEDLKAGQEGKEKITRSPVKDEDLEGPASEKKGEKEPDSEEKASEKDQLIDQEEPKTAAKDVKLDLKPVVGEAPAEDIKAEPEPLREKKLSEVPEVVPEGKKVENSPEQKGFFGRIKERFSHKEEVSAPEKAKEEQAEEPSPPEPSKEEKPEKRSFLGKISDRIRKRSISESKFEEIFWDLEMILLENNVAVEVIEKIKGDLKDKLVNTDVIKGSIEDVINSTLQESLSSLFSREGIDIIGRAKEKKPLVICFIGVNGSGKTTNLAKVATYLKDKGLKPVMAACDTFRAAAIQQLEDHAKRTGVRIIKHDYGSDAAAVAFDAINHAEATGKDVVLIDTAGRSHANANLMDELKKVVRVSKPDLKIFVGDSLTGNDAVEQAKSFDDAVGIDGIILTKVDVDEKGGAAISVSYVTGKPILFIGTGQEYKDLKPFDKDIILQNLGISA